MTFDLERTDIKKVPLFTKMPPVIFNVEHFLDRRSWGDVIRLFCISEVWINIMSYKTEKDNYYPYVLVVVILVR